MVMKPKNSNFDETLKLKLWWKSITQIMMKIKKTQIVIELKNSYCGKTQNPELWWNLKTQIVMKIKKSNGEKLKNANGDKV